MKHILIASLLAIPLLHCTGELPLSDLVNNTITLKVLGTYESNDSFAVGTVNTSLPKDDVITGTAITGASPTLAGTPPIVDYANSLTPANIDYYIDIAEIRLARGQGKSSSQSISDYWSQFAISRQLMCSSYSSADGRGLSNCSDSAGIDRLSAFFNGGFTYPAVDVPSGSFNHLGVYFRRFVTYPAARFYGDGTHYSGDTPTKVQSVTAAFDNRTIYGLDIESFLQNAYGATNAEPMMFPLQRKDLALNIYNDHEPYVMEVRIFLKNAMMAHIIQSTGNATTATDATNSAFIYLAPADWNVNHAFQDLTNSTRHGGAVAMTARVYQPAKVGSINITGGAATSVEYFAVVPAGTVFANPYVTTLPLAATRGTNTSITNLPPGSYDVYRTCDKRLCSSASTAGTCDNVLFTSIAGRTIGDGFPETAAPCGTYTVTSGTPTDVAIGSCSAACP